MVDLLADIKLTAAARVYVLNLTIFSLGKPQASVPLAISHFFALLPEEGRSDLYRKQSAPHEQTAKYSSADLTADAAA